MRIVIKGSKSYVRGGSMSHVVKEARSMDMMDTGRAVTPMIGSFLEGKKPYKEKKKTKRVRCLIRDSNLDPFYVRTEMDSYRQEKIQKFEEFVDRRLKPDLIRAIAERDKVFEQQKTLYPFSLFLVFTTSEVCKLFPCLFYLNLATREFMIFLTLWLQSSDLRRNIENLEKNSVTSLRTLVNLGSEVYMQADVPDTKRIFVDIGLGFHVEFTWSEAINFISQREEKLSRQIEEYTRLIASIKAQIKLVCEGIRELLQLPAEKPLPE
ncbi:Protein UXT-like protein [Morus notabilis]|uniref:Protein UXT-like protein n=1 Tax=Morus notabilis TaxID=981085 RepID=W9S0C2_9ROSA|nr:Protein UXT-like protein [Morus notabilis]